MNLHRQLRTRMRHALGLAERALGSGWDRAERIYKQSIEKIFHLNESDHRALSQFVRPQFAGNPLPGRSLLEPALAVAAISVLIGTAGLAAVSIAGVLIAGWIIYAVLTHVFGLELNLAMPGL